MKGENNRATPKIRITLLYVDHMLNPKIVKLLNEQINKEFYSAYLYMDMANYYADQGLNGFENWFLVQAQEERDHAMLFRQYLLNNGESIILTQIDAPNEKYNDYKAPLVKALEHERLVTASINNIYEAALRINDFRTKQFLDWFINEQSEEEKNADDNIKKYDLFAGDSKGLYMLDNEFKARVYAAPSLVLD
jgi:ferritin